MQGTDATSELLARLREQIAAVERPASPAEWPVISTGCPALDEVLPFGGVRRGSLTEWLSERSGSGAESLALLLTREACRDPGAVVLLDRDRQVYPPAVAAWGIAQDRLIVVHPADEADELWAADQALRSRAAAAVWLWRERLRPHDFRRLGLAAADGGAVGVLLRPARARGQPTWADVQLLVRPRPGAAGRRLSVEVTRCRGSARRPVVEVELDDVSGAPRTVGPHETLRVPAPPRLAGPATGRRATGTDGAGGPAVPPRRPPG
jgi:protein ImuA